MIQLLSNIVRAGLFTFIVFSNVIISSNVRASLTLNWTDTSNNEDMFKIERNPSLTGISTFEQIGTVNANTTTYIDTKVTGGVSYCYRVRASNAAGDSGYTNEACRTAPAAIDTQAPSVSLTVPTNGATVSGSAVTVAASASDNVGVVGVQFLLDGATLGSEDTTAPYSTAWDTTKVANGSHTLTARARDAAGNTATSAAVTVTVSNPTTNPTPSPSSTSDLVAAYGFNEGGGVSTADTSGGSNTGTVVGATWGPGEYGAALDFTGKASVQVSSTALNNLVPFTYCAWIYPRSQGGANDARIVHKGTNTARKQLQTDSSVANSLALYVDRANGAAKATSTVDTLTLNQWQFVCGTYSEADGPRVYRNGVEVRYSSRTIGAGATVSDAGDQLFIGNRSTADEGWDGVIDEVRIYNRVLTASEIQADMTTPVGASASPSSFTLTVAKAGSGGGTVSSAPTGINCGSDCSEAYSSDTVVTLTATPATGSTFAGWSGAGCSGAGSCTLTLAADAIVTATFTADTQAPSVSLTAPSNGATVSGSAVTVAASASDNVGVVGVQFLLDGATLGSEDTTAPYSTAWDTTKVANGSHTLTARARDAAGNTATSAAVIVTVSNPTTNTASPSSTSALVAAYGFNEGGGASTADASGGGNTGTLVGATWGPGEYGAALDFTGKASVQVNSAALNNLAPFTYCAWIYPRSQGGANDGRIVHKGTNTARKQLQTDSSVANSLALYVDRANGAAKATSTVDTLTLNQWQFVCGTYSEADGPRVYRNGVEVRYSMRTIGAGATVSDAGDQLFIGNRSTADKGWDGVIDEVRIYNRVLTASEIQADMTTPVGASSSTAKFPQDAKVRIGIFRPSTGEWFLDVNGNGAMDDCSLNGCVAHFGESDELPVVGDWTGTGTTKIGVFDPQKRLWMLDRNDNDQWDNCTVDLCLGPDGWPWGLPIVGRWAASATTDRIGVYLPKWGYWLLDLDGSGTWDECGRDGCWSFFPTGGLPVVGDWTGTGTTKPGIFDPATGQWNLDKNGDAQWGGCTEDLCLGPFGLTGDQPVAGDWDGSGTTKIGTYDPETGMWELDLNGNGRFDGCGTDACLGPFGEQGDIPVVGKW